MTLFDIFRVIRKRIAVVIICTLAGLLSCGCFLLVKKPSYTARATVYVTIDMSGSDNRNAVGTINSASALALAKSKSYMSLFSDKSTAVVVKEKLGLPDSVDTLAQSISAVNMKDSPSIQVSASAKRADQAQKMADAAAEVVGERVIELEGKGSPIHVNLLSSATLSTPVKNPDAGKFLPLSIVVGLFVGIIFAFAVEQFDFKLRRPQQVSELTKATVLAQIPKLDDISDKQFSEGKVLEQVRKVRTAINYMAIDSDIRTVLFTSSQACEGKSSISEAYARVSAMSGKKVLLVDCDLRCPTICRRFNLKTEIGLTHVLSGTLTAADAIQTTDYSNVYVLPAGDTVPNPSELLSSNSMKELLQKLSEEYYIVLDSPPVLPVTDSVVLSNLVDAVVLVVGLGALHEEDLLRALELVEGATAKMAGIVLNMVDPRLIPNSEYGSKYILD